MEGPKFKLIKTYSKNNKMEWKWTSAIINMEMKV